MDDILNGMNNSLNGMITYIQKEAIIENLLNKVASKAADEFLQSDVGVCQSLLSQTFELRYIFEKKRDDFEDVGIKGVELIISTSYSESTEIKIKNLLVDTLFFYCGKYSIYSAPRLAMYGIKIISNNKKSGLHITDRVIETVSLKKVRITLLDISSLVQYRMYKEAGIHNINIIQLVIKVTNDNLANYIELLTKLLIDCDNFRKYSGELSVRIYFNKWDVEEHFLVFKEELRTSLNSYRSGYYIYQEIKNIELSEMIDYKGFTYCWIFNHFKKSKLEDLKSKLGFIDE